MFLSIGGWHQSKQFKQLALFHKLPNIIRIYQQSLNNRLFSNQ